MSKRAAGWNKHKYGDIKKYPNGQNLKSPFQDQGDAIGIIHFFHKHIKHLLKYP